MKKMSKLKRVSVVLGVLVFVFAGMLFGKKINSNAQSKIPDDTFSFVFNNYVDLSTDLNSFVVPKTGEYNFYCLPTKQKDDGTEHYWKIYVLNDDSYEREEGTLRFIHQAYSETARVYSEKTKLYLKEGQYVYAVCSENGFIYDEDYDTFRCPLIVQEVKDKRNIAPANNSGKLPSDVYQFVFNKNKNMSVDGNSLVVPKDGTYKVSCAPNKKGNYYWNLYVFDDNTYKKNNSDLKAMFNNYKPTYKVDKNGTNITLKKGQYVYAICSENGYKHTKKASNLRCPLTIKMTKEHNR